GVFLPPQEAQGNPSGATSRLGASALPIARNGSPLDMALSARIAEARVVYGTSADNSHHLKTGYNAPSQLMWEGATPWYRLMYFLSSSYLHSSGSSSPCTPPGPRIR